MKKLLPIVLALMILLTACGASSSNSFNNYLDESDTYSNRLLPSGATIKSFDLQRDDDQYYTVLSFTPYFDDSNIYAWAALAPKVQKEDMEYIAEMVIDYATSKEWDNDYYLYITSGTGSVSFVYDYEAGTLFYPPNIGILRFMYKEFDTMDAKELLEKEHGEDFLVKYNMAEIKHKKLELVTSTPSCTVGINDGKFSHSGLAESKIYQ